MRTSEIRETFLGFFEERGHRRVASASLIPAPDDTSTLLTVAGMQPFKPYFLGREQPPAPRLTSSQRCFRTPDIEQVGNTARHLTCFEMLGNFSIGDYFKREAIGFGWELSTQGFGFDPDRIWISVFAGDEELGLGPDEEAIAIWRDLGVPDERIVRLSRSENFWQAGARGPCGPCSEMYLDRGPEHGSADEGPGDDSDRFLEYWNHVFMTYEMHEDGSLTDLPFRNIDTGLGLERMAVIQQGVESVFDTDGFRPLIDLAVELSGRDYQADPKTTRAMRIIADHARGMTRLIADGVVPSNEDRGYVLRRIMRRAIQQGRILGLEPPYLARFAEAAIELGSPSHPEVAAERETIMRWVSDEEASFGRTLDRGNEMLASIIAEARESGLTEVDAARAFELHDTFGFPFELTSELLRSEGLGVDEAGFDQLMTAQRERARAGASVAAGEDQGQLAAIAATGPPSQFVGYERLASTTAVAAAASSGSGGQSATLVKLEQSPFYAAGGGQVSDSGTVRWNGVDSPVLDVVRVGEDQVVRIDATDPPDPGAEVEAVVDRSSRHATMRNHTATHLLHAALREALGTHVRQAGSAVRPDKLRFDFSHSAPMSPAEVRRVEDRVNGWIKDSLSVRAIEMEIDEAKRLGAMALFGEKYGDWVRMVEVDGVSRELCGGTHVANTAEVGIFKITSEGSSASNVRRIEALTGPAAIDWFIERSDAYERAGAILGAEDPVSGAERVRAKLAELERGAANAGAAAAGELAGELAAEAESLGGASLVCAEVEGPVDAKALLDLADRVRAKLGESGAAVLGSRNDNKVALVASFGSTVVDAGASAAELIGELGPSIGGGGGGRATAAQAGGRDPSGLDSALAAARDSIAALTGAGS